MFNIWILFLIAVMWASLTKNSNTAEGRISQAMVFITAALVMFISLIVEALTS